MNDKRFNRFVRWAMFALATGLVGAGVGFIPNIISMGDILLLGFFLIFISLGLLIGLALFYYPEEDMSELEKRFSQDESDFQEEVRKLSRMLQKLQEQDERKRYIEGKDIIKIYELSDRLEKLESKINASTDVTRLQSPSVDDAQAPLLDNDDDHNQQQNQR